MCFYKFRRLTIGQNCSAVCTNEGGHEHAVSKLMYLQYLLFNGKVGKVAIGNIDINNIILLIVL